MEENIVKFAIIYNKNPVTIMMKKDSYLKSAFLAFCERNRLSPDAILFSYNDTVLDGEKTPMDYGFIDNDTVMAQL